MLHSLHRHTAEARRHTAEARRETARHDTGEAPKAEHPVAAAGRQFVRYALVVVIAWIGALKYSSYEATAIHPLIANSPIMSWFYSILGVRSLAATLGTVEIIAAVLIALRFVSPRLSAVGSAMAILLFLGTLSFLFTTPGVMAAGGFPVLSVLPGQFLLKDLVLLGAALWTLGDSLGAAKSKSRTQPESGVPGQRNSPP
jgi:uncharacterized membrane protein YkgB